MLSLLAGLLAFDRIGEIMLMALLASAMTPPDRWVLVSGRAAQYEEYLDTESIVRNADKVALWTRRDLTTDQGTVWNELEINCRMRTETVLAHVQDDGRTVSHNSVRPHREPLPIPAGSTAEKIFSIVC